MSNWGRSNSRSAHRRNVATSSRDHSRGSEAVEHTRSINFFLSFFSFPLRLWSFSLVRQDDGETEPDSTTRIREYACIDAFNKKIHPAIKYISRRLRKNIT